MFNRSATYPQLASYQERFCQNPQFISSLIDQADGIFFNGGDQFLALSSLADTRLGQKKLNSVFNQLKNKFNSGRLVVAGTSAGTAVQSGGLLNNQQLPMITNGASIKGFFKGALASDFPPSSYCELKRTCGEGIAKDSLTYFKPGGFNLLPIGILDTHFAERDRAFRLIRLLQSTPSKQGFGIDENTALVVTEEKGNFDFTTIGEGAVWTFNVDSSINVTATFDSRKSRKLSDRLGNDHLSKLLRKALKSKPKEAKSNIQYEEMSAECSVLIESMSDTSQVSFELKFQ